MLNHTSSSLEAPVNRCEWDSRWEMHRTENETACDKSWGQNAKVTTVMSFTAPKKIPGVCDTSHYFKHLAMATIWQIKSFKYHFLSISKQYSDTVQLTKCCAWFRRIKGFWPLQREIRIKWSTWNPKKVTNVLLKFTRSQLPSLLFYLGLSFCVSYIEKHHLCHDLCPVEFPPAAVQQTENIPASFEMRDQTALY